MFFAADRFALRATALRGVLAGMCGCLLLAGATFAQAAEYRSIAPSFAILYNAPTERARKMFIAPHGMPVERILDLDGWTKIRDAEGDLSWVATQALSDKRTVVVTAVRTSVLAAMTDTAPLMATADKGVLFDMTTPAQAGWVGVRHQDGTAGYVRSNEVWGD